MLKLEKLSRDELDAMGRGVNMARYINRPIDVTTVESSVYNQQQTEMTELFTSIPDFIKNGAVTKMHMGAGTAKKRGLTPFGQGVTHDMGKARNLGPLFKEISRHVKYQIDENGRHFFDIFRDIFR